MDGTHCGTKIMAITHYNNTGGTSTHTGDAVNVKDAARLKVARQAFTHGPNESIGDFPSSNLEDKAIAWLEAWKEHLRTAEPTTGAEYRFLFKNEKLYDKIFNTGERRLAGGHTGVQLSLHQIRHRMSRWCRAFESNYYYIPVEAFESFIPVNSKSLAQASRTSVSFLTVYIPQEEHAAKFEIIGVTYNIKHSFRSALTPIKPVDPH